MVLTVGDAVDLLVHAGQVEQQLLALHLAAAQTGEQRGPVVGKRGNVVAFYVVGLALPVADLLGDLAVVAENVAQDLVKVEEVEHCRFPLGRKTVLALDRVLAGLVVLRGHSGVLGQIGAVIAPLGALGDDALLLALVGAVENVLAHRNRGGSLGGIGIGPVGKERDDLCGQRGVGLLVGVEFAGFNPRPLAVGPCLGLFGAPLGGLLECVKKFVDGGPQLALGFLPCPAALRLGPLE